MRTYRDFILRILPDRVGGFVQSVSSPAGETSAPFILPPFDPNAASRSVPLPASGDALSSAVFQGRIGELYRLSLEIAARNAHGLRLRVMLDPAEPLAAPLQGLPWELLRLPGQPEYLALDPDRPVVRYLAVPEAVPESALATPLAVALVVANPRLPGRAPLDLERERRQIELALSDLVQRGQVATYDIFPATLGALRSALRRRPADILHFMGHGAFDRRTGTGQILFVAADGSADPITGEELVNALAGCEPRLAVLNACETARADGEREAPPFAGVANALVLSGLNAVVAMLRPVTDAAAIAFSRRFYETLAAREPFEAAVAEGRQAIYNASTTRLEWSLPALFLRGAEAAPITESTIGTVAVSRSAAKTRALRRAALVGLLLLATASAGGGFLLWRNQTVAGELSAARTRLAAGPAGCEKARPAIERSLGLRPTAEAYVLLATCQSDLAAIDSLRKAVEIGPRDPDARLAYGRLLAKIGDHLAAQTQLERADQLGASHGTVQLELGEIYLELGDLEEAKRGLVAAEGAADDDPFLRSAALFGLGRTSLREVDALPAEQHAVLLGKAEGHFRQALELLPDGDSRAAEITVWLIDLLVRSGRSEEACTEARDFDRRFQANGMIWRARVDEVRDQPPCKKGSP